MFEVKAYDNLNDLINDTRMWLDQNYQNFPFTFKMNEEDCEIDCDNGENIEDAINFIQESVDYMKWEKFVVARKKPNEKFDLHEDDIVFAILRCPKFKLDKFICKLQSLGEAFILERPESILIYDGRNSVIGLIECIIEDDSIDTYCKEQEERFNSLKKEEINQLYEEYQKDCKEFGEKFYPDEDTKSIENFKKNMMDV